MWHDKGLWVCNTAVLDNVHSMKTKVSLLWHDSMTHPGFPQGDNELSNGSFGRQPGPGPLPNVPS